MALNNTSINTLWDELKALGPAFIIDKGHDFGSERTGDKDKPAGFNKKGETKAGAKFLARFCKLLCSAFVSDFPPDDFTGEIVWSDQEIIYYTSPVYALLWSASKSHSIDPFFDNTESVYLKKYPIRAGVCKSTPKAFPFKDYFFKDDSSAKAMKKAALPTSVAGNPCKYDDQWTNTNRMGIVKKNTRQIEFLVGSEDEMKTMSGDNTNKITGGIWRGKNNNVPDDKVVISDSPVKKQTALISNLVSNGELKAGTSSFLDAANSTKGERKVYGIEYNMPFLAARTGNNKFYINVNVSNNNGDGRVFGAGKSYYTLVYSLWRKQGTSNWRRVPDREYTLNIQESVKLFPGEVSLLGCLINTLVNRNNDSPTAGQQYQWDNVKTIINSMTNPINPIQRLIKQEQILANLIRIAKLFADTIYEANVTNKVKFVFAFIMQIKTMGDFSSLKDCEYLEKNLNDDEFIPCFILTKDTFLRKIVNPFYQGYRGKLIGDANLKPTRPYFNNRAFTIRRTAEPQVGGTRDEYDENSPFSLEYLEKNLNDTHSGVCDRVLAGTVGLYDDPSEFCSFEYGQMKDIDAVIEAMNVDNIYANIDAFASDDFENVDAEYFRDDVGDEIHEGLFGNYLKSTNDFNKEKNIWTFSRGYGGNKLDDYINLTTTIGEEELRGIVEIFKDNYPEDYYLERSSEALLDTAGQRNFTNSINYLFIRAWQFRQYALQQCREHVPIGDETIATHPCVFPVDMLLDEKRWFTNYFADQEGSYTYWPTEEAYAAILQENAMQRNMTEPKPRARRRTRGKSRRRRSLQLSSEGASSSTQGGGTRRKKRKKKRTKLRKKKNRKTKRRRRKRKKTRRRR